MSVTPKRPRSRGASIPRDALCETSVELARDAACEVGGDHVGDHVGCVAEAERVVTHYFESLLPGYGGWRWAVTVARAPRQRSVTVSEVVQLPGPDALLAPEWVPWSERLRPGDLGVGDILPTAVDDDRLMPAYLDSGEPDDSGAAWEPGLGRARVMSPLGRAEAAERWHQGETGPDTPMARHAPGRCGTCGFYLPLAGSLRPLFGVCGNEFAPADGRVVAADHGCGAHSEAFRAAAVAPEALPPPVYDDSEVEVVPEPVQRPRVLRRRRAAAEGTAGDAGEQPGESGPVDAGGADGAVPAGSPPEPS